MMDMTRRAAAEFFGTFWLVLGDCGAAVLAVAFPALGIGYVGTVEAMLDHPGYQNVFGIHPGGASGQQLRVAPREKHLSVS